MTEYHQNIKDFLDYMSLETLQKLKYNKNPRIAAKTIAIMEMIADYHEFLRRQEGVIFQGKTAEEMMFTKVDSDQVIQGPQSLVIARRFTGIPFVESDEIS